MPNKEYKPLSSQSIKKVLKRIVFDRKGLVPVIVQQYNSGEVLMLAWMNKDALTETLKTGSICYYSRSRNSLWHKGEQSGQIQELKDFRFDFVIDTQCLSDIDDPQIRSNTVNDMHKVLADDGILVSVSTLQNKDEAEHFIQTLNNEGFYLQKLLPVISKSLDKWQGYTKLVFTKIENEMIYNVSDFFEEMLSFLDQKNHS